MIKNVILGGMFLLFVTSLNVIQSDVKSGFELLLEQNKDDKEIFDGLKNFEKGGIENELDMSSTTPEQIIDTAKTFMGVPHCMGGLSKHCIDCSGLLTAVFAKNGIDLPHNSVEQGRFGKVIANKDSLQKGDMLFFVRTFKTSYFLTHSGIYVGDGEFIHTSASRGVQIIALDNSYWKEKYLFGTRVF